MIRDRFSVIRESYSGLAAKEIVASVVRHHRIQASPGYRDAANLLLEELRQSGISAHIESFPAEYGTWFWKSRSFQEWAVKSATLHLTEPGQDRRKLADYRELKLSLIQRSAPFQGRAQVVVLEDGLRPSDYVDLDVAGKLVLTRGDVAEVRQLAVERYGAIGIIFDGMSDAPPVRLPLDLADARQYTSFWWTGQPGEVQCFGFVLSPRQGHWLRQLIHRRDKEGLPPVTVEIDIDSCFYDGEIEVVEASITGHELAQESVIIVSHLCHPQPSANDNATGVAATEEAARTLQRLIDAGKLPRPRRTIRFLWMPEMTGSYAYLARHEREIQEMVAGLNLDMVGEDQSLTGSVLLIERPPDASASFAPDLLERLREELFDEAVSLTGLGGFPLFRYATTGFSGGSDHYIFSDPTVGVPMPMLIQWPDKFYHTSADTLDKVDPNSLARAGTLAAAYAHFVADAGEAETTWLAHEMFTRFQVRLVQTTQAAITEYWAAGAEPPMARLERLLPCQLERFGAALSTLTRLWPGIGSTVPAIYAEAKRYHDLSRDRASRIRESQRAADKPLDEWEQSAAHRIPLRHYRGPGISIAGLATLPLEERLEWQAFVSDRPGAHTIPVLAEYWCDGHRSILEIIELIEMELGIRDSELIVRHFEIMRKLGLVTYLTVPSEVTT